MEIMTSKIFYFSGTGNSFKIAKDLAKETNAELISIAQFEYDKNNKTEIDSEIIGLVFPVYMWGPPLIVKRFLENVKLKKDSYIFGVVTCGGSPGGTLIEIDKILKSEGSKLDSGFYVLMPENYVPMYNMPLKDKQEKKFKKAEEKVKKIIDIIKNKKASKIETSSAIANILLTKGVYKISSPQIPKLDKHFWVDSNCDGCKICYKVCPVENITMENNKPVWKHHCEMCLSCIHLCPKKAIQYKQSTKKKRRYHHPEISLNEFFKR